MSCPSAEVAHELYLMKLIGCILIGTGQGYHSPHHSPPHTPHDTPEQACQPLLRMPSFHTWRRLCACCASHVRWMARSSLPCDRVSLLVFDLLRPHADKLDLQLYRTVRRKGLGLGLWLWLRLSFCTTCLDNPELQHILDYSFCGSYGHRYRRRHLRSQ